MKTFYRVRSTYDDQMRSFAYLDGTVEAEKLPKTTCPEKHSKDIYEDYFETEAAARAFIKETLDSNKR